MQNQRGTRDLGDDVLHVDAVEVVYQTDSVGWRSRAAQIDNPLPENPLFNGQPVTVDSGTTVFLAATGDLEGGEFTGSLTATSLPAAFSLFVGGLGVMGLLGRRKKQKIVAV
jgi:hypothetical protein